MQTFNFNIFEMNSMLKFVKVISMAFIYVLMLIERERERRGSDVVAGAGPPGRLTGAVEVCEA